MDKEKQEIKDAILELMDLADIYQESGFEYDYDEILKCVKKASSTIRETVRGRRPDQLPEEVSWNETLYDAEEDFNPFVYKGDMSIIEFEKAQESFLDDEIEI